MQHSNIASYPHHHRNHHENRECAFTHEYDYYLHAESESELCFLPLLENSNGQRMDLQ
jgi:hypothetical protein